MSRYVANIQIFRLNCTQMFYAYYNQKIQFAIFFRGGGGEILCPLTAEGGGIDANVRMFRLATVMRTDNQDIRLYLNGESNFYVY